MAAIVPAELAFAGDGTPVLAALRRHLPRQPGGLEQARHVFLAGNDLPARWRGAPASSSSKPASASA
jgi:tRNA 5-methylaminomethyl-2-thiouridine biosynthesis bifunctional protein